MTDTTAAPTSRLAFHSLIWLMPAAYALHIGEEYLGGFDAWVTHVVGGSMSPAAFALNNAGFMALLLGLTAWTARSRSGVAAFLLMAWAAGNLFWDAVFHVVTTQMFDRYSPGLDTAALLYIPTSLAVATLALHERVLSVRAFAGAVAVGAGLMGFVIWYGLFHFAL